MNKTRISTLLDDETLKWVAAEAKKKSISKSAVIRQIVEMSHNFSKKTCNISRSEIINGAWPTKEQIKNEINKYDPEFGTGDN